MIDILNVSVGLAFIAGVASFLSPCVLALVPAYVGYLSGKAAGVKEGEDHRIQTFLHGVAFVMGFSVIFISLGLFAGALGGVLNDFKDIIAKVGGIIVVIFGIHMIGIIRIPFLEMDSRVQYENRTYSYGSSFLMGIFFSAGWSPCVGPVLGAILTLAVNGGSLSQGLILLTSYSLGLAVPFLISALGIGWVTTLIRKYGKIMRVTEIVMGVLMVIVGVMLSTGLINLIATQFQGWSFGI